jgi:hypothetical protein
MIKQDTSGSIIMNSSIGGVVGIADSKALMVDGGYSEL